MTIDLPSPEHSGALIGFVTALPVIVVLGALHPLVKFAMRILLVSAALLVLAYGPLGTIRVVENLFGLVGPLVAAVAENAYAIATAHRGKG